MTAPHHVELPVTVRLATDADITTESAHDAVARSLNARLHSFGLPARVKVEVERAGSGFEIVAGTQLLAAALPGDLMTRPLPVVAQACVTGITTPLAPDSVIELLWESARPAVGPTPQAPVWFASMVRAVIWAGGYVGDPGPLAAAVGTAMADLDRGGAVDTDVLAEVVMRPYIREVALAADDETLPQVVKLVRGDVAVATTHNRGSAPAEAADQSTIEDSSVAPAPAFWQLMAEGLGPLISVTPPLTFVADPDVPIGYVSVRLSGIDLGILPVPDPGQAVACVPPGILQDSAGVLAPVFTGLPERSQTWSLIRRGSEAEKKVREELHPSYLDHLAWGTALFLSQRPHWLPSTIAVGKILDSLTQSSQYAYTVWFARAIFNDEQVTSMLRMVLALGVPLAELPLALRDVLLSLREQLPSDLGPVMTAEAASTARRRYDHRCAGGAWDASEDPH